MEHITDFNVKNIPCELKTALFMLKSKDVHSLQSIMSEIPSDFNWDRFLDLTIHHRIFPMLYPKLMDINKDIFPSSIFNHLKGLYRHNTLKMLFLSSVMKDICNLFNQNNINTLVLKGPILGTNLYGDISLRTSGDLDVLVQMRDLGRVNKLLEDLGYEKDDYIQTILGDWRWRHHHVTYIHPKTGVKLEIHWRLNPGPGREPSFKDLWNRKRTEIVSEQPIYILGREDLFLFLVSHGARHGWSRLRWLLDINQLVNQHLNWKLLTKMLTKYNYTQVGGQAILLNMVLLDMKPTKEMSLIIQDFQTRKIAKLAIFYLERMVNLHNDPVPLDIATYHRSYLFQIKTIKQKIYFVLSFLFPYPEDAHVLPLPKKVHFLYFPLRPFLWIWRKYKKYPQLER